VPDELFKIVNDTSLFSTSADLTTKEILKRLGEIRSVPQPNIVSPGGQNPRSREGRSSAPVVHRVGEQQDPYVWQNESSVRHVPGPGQDHSTPPQRDWDLSNPSLPYAHRSSGSQERINGSPNRFSARGSGMHKQPIPGTG
ncbi:hypothetical protein LTS18_012090, partial [Coniosporium uncinatum]